MSQIMPDLWQANLELSLLLCAVLLARVLLRRTTRNHNAYLLWAAIPLGLLGAWSVRQIPLTEPPVPAVSVLVQDYVIQPGSVVTTWSMPYMADLLLFWGLVSLALLFRLSIQHLRLRQQLAQLKVADVGLFATKTPVIGIQAPEFSPAVYGFLRPRIYFPIHLLDELTPQQVTLILQHEEHHIQQKHLWLNLAWDMLVCVLWFNPLVYVARQQFRHDQELFCDYLVLNRADPQAQDSYGHALLSTISATHSVSLLCSWKAFNQLEERIMNIKTPASFMSRFVTILGAFSVVTAASLYTVSANEYGQESPSNEAVADHESNLHVQHFDDNVRIEWLENGRQLIRNNDQYFAVENGQQRPMSNAERATFEREMEQSRQHDVERLQNEEVHRQAEREYHRDQAEYAHELSSIEHQTHRLDMEAQVRQLEIEREVAEQESQLAHARQQLQSTRAELKNSYASREISEQALANAERSLANAERKIAREQQRSQREAARAASEIKRIQAEIERSVANAQTRSKKRGRAHGSVSTVPIPPEPPMPPLAPLAPTAPIAPIAPEPPLAMFMEEPQALPSRKLVHKDGRRFDPRQAH